MIVSDIAMYYNSDALPDQWDCSMNYWDPERASCDAPEEDYEVEREVPQGDFESARVEKVDSEELSIVRDDQESHDNIKEQEGRE